MMKPEIQTAAPSGGGLDGAAPAMQRARETYLFGRQCLNVTASAGVVAALVAAFVVIADIGLRTAGSRGVVGTFDLVLLSVAYVANLTIPWGFIAMTHIRLDGPLEMAPLRLRAAFDLVAAVAGAALFVYVAIYGIAQMKLSAADGNVSQTLALSLTWYWIPVIAGAVLSVAAGALLSLRFIIVLVTGNDISPEGQPS